MTGAESERGRVERGELCGGSDDPYDGVGVGHDRNVFHDHPLLEVGESGGRLVGREDGEGLFAVGEAVEIGAEEHAAVDVGGERVAAAAG
jgi:hypothetical protein